jgi:hypothetical protein
LFRLLAFAPQLHHKRGDSKQCDKVEQQHLEINRRGIAFRDSNAILSNVNGIGRNLSHLVVLQRKRSVNLYGSSATCQQPHTPIVVQLWCSTGVSRFR